MLSAAYHSLFPAKSLRRLLAPAIVWFSLFPTVTTAADVPDEAAVRAAMIFNLLKFAKWPDSQPTDTALQICAIETSPGLVTALQSLQQRNVGRRELKMQTVPAKELSACDVLVTDAPQLPYTIAQLQERSVLTIGEAGFIDRGGMIGITVIDNRVRFEINLEAMKRSGISLPSQVLQLAVRTR